jgi:hypothetical protein
LLSIEFLTFIISRFLFIKLIIKIKLVIILGEMHARTCGTDLAGKDTFRSSPSVSLPEYSFRSPKLRIFFKNCNTVIEFLAFFLSDFTSENRRFQRSVLHSYSMRSVLKRALARRNARKAHFPYRAYVISTGFHVTYGSMLYFLRIIHSEI